MTRKEARENLIRYVEEHGGCGCCSNAPDLGVLDAFIDDLLSTEDD